MDKVSFTSAIKPVSAREFKSALALIDKKNSVNYPWTLKESIKAPAAFTTGVRDCSVVGITDGKEVLMLHLCPTVGVNRNFDAIRRFIAQKADLKNPDLQAIIIGGRKDKMSRFLSDKLTEIINNYNIPLSEVKISGDNCSINTAYNSVTDEWLITCSKIDKYIRKGVKNGMEILKNIFQKVEISDVDEVQPL